jgi:hypothetical protein
VSPDELRFWDKVRIGDGCWLWTASQDAIGYGAFRAQRRLHRAHRMAWMLTHGEIPAGLCVCHRCDVRACVRPGHLFLGTHQENIRDRDAKGRQARLRGSLAGAAKATEANVLEIRSRHGRGESIAGIARAIGLSTSQVGRIVRGESWAHLEAVA